MKPELVSCVRCGTPFLALPSAKGRLQSVCADCILKRLRRLDVEYQEQQAEALARAKEKLAGERFAAEARKGG